MSSPEAAGSRAGLRSLSWTSHFRHAAGAEGGDGRFLGLWASLAGTRGNSGGWTRSVRPGPASVGPTWASTGQGVLAKEGDPCCGCNAPFLPPKSHPRPGRTCVLFWGMRQVAAVTAVPPSPACTALPVKLPGHGVAANRGASYPGWLWVQQLQWAGEGEGALGLRCGRGTNL